MKCPACSWQMDDFTPLPPLEALGYASSRLTRSQVPVWLFQSGRLTPTTPFWALETDRCRVFGFLDHLV